MYLRYAGYTDIGAVREENQDRLVADGCLTGRSGAFFAGDHPDLASLGRPLVLGVVDGMGGYAGGGDAAGIVASRIAALAGDMPQAEWEAWLARLSGEVNDVGMALGQPMMGATMALLAFGCERFTSINVGDCRSYRLMDGVFVQVSEDDRMGDGSGRITQALGGPRRLEAMGQAMDAHYKNLPYAAFPGSPERFLICSDGLHGIAAKQELLGLISSPGDVETTCRSMAAFALDRQPRDNITLLVAEVGVPDDADELATGGQMG